MAKAQVNVWFGFLMKDDEQSPLLCGLLVLLNRRFILPISYNPRAAT